MISLRVLSPALFDCNAFSCRTLLFKGKRSITTSTAHRAKSENENYQINPEFENRNPRALETMGLAYKQRGWQLQAPRNDYYLKLVFEQNSMNTMAKVIHHSGKTVVSASTKEVEIAEHLYSNLDTSAAINIGRVLSRRMLEAGITDVFYDRDAQDITSEKQKAFFDVIQEANIELSEPAEIPAISNPGIDYHGYHRYNEKRVFGNENQKTGKHFEVPGNEKVNENKTEELSENELEYHS